MNSKLFLLTISLLLGIISCTDQDRLSKNFNPQTNSRGDGDCGYCDELKVEISYSPIVDNCCKAQVFIKSISGLKNCKQMVFVNGVFVQYIEEDLTVLNYSICPGEQTVVRVMGFDDATKDFTKICFEERLSCAGCCDNVTFESYSCGKTTDSGCCNYGYKFFNNSTCPMQVFDSSGISVLTIPANATATQNFSACPNGAKKYQIGKSTSEICKEFAVLPICNLACNCGTSVITTKALKSTLKGCCRFTISAFNRSACTLYLFTADGSVVATIDPGTTYRVTVEECFKKTYYLGSVPNVNACQYCSTATITCKK